MKIAFEGVDYSGKSAAVKIASKILKIVGANIRFIKMKNDTLINIFSTLPPEMQFSGFLGYGIAKSKEDFKEDFVLYDRTPFSPVMYYHTLGEIGDQEYDRIMNILGERISYDFLFLLDLSNKELLKRFKERKNKSHVDSNLDLLQKVKTQYKDITRYYSTVIINTDLDKIGGIGNGIITVFEYVINSDKLDEKKRKYILNAINLLQELPKDFYELERVLDKTPDPYYQLLEPTIPKTLEEFHKQNHLGKK